MQAGRTRRRWSWSAPGQARRVRRCAGSQGRGRGSVPEEGPVLLRRGAEMPVEGGSGSGGGAEPGEAADVFYGLVGRLQQFPGTVEARAGEPGHGRGSGLLAEPADEGPAGHVGAFGERVEAERLGEVFEHPVPERGEFAAAGFRDEPFDVLRLAAG